MQYFQNKWLILGYTRCMAQKLTYQAIQNARRFVENNLTHEECAKLDRIARWEFRGRDEQIVYWLYQTYGNAEYDLDAFVQQWRTHARRELRSPNAQALLVVKEQLRTWRTPPKISCDWKELLDEAVRRGAQTRGLTFGRAVQSALASYLRRELPEREPVIRAVFSRKWQQRIVGILGFTHEDCQELRRCARIMFRSPTRHLLWIVREYWIEFFEQVVSERTA